MHICAAQQGVGGPGYNEALPARYKITNTAAYMHPQIGVCCQLNTRTQGRKAARRLRSTPRQRPATGNPSHGLCGSWGEGLHRATAPANKKESFRAPRPRAPCPAANVRLRPRPSLSAPSSKPLHRATAPRPRTPARYMQFRTIPSKECRGRPPRVRAQLPTWPPRHLSCYPLHATPPARGPCSVTNTATAHNRSSLTFTYAQVRAWTACQDILMVPATGMSYPSAILNRPQIVPGLPGVPIAVPYVAAILRR